MVVAAENRTECELLQVKLSEKEIADKNRTWNKAFTCGCSTTAYEVLDSTQK